MGGKVCIFRINITVLDREVLYEISSWFEEHFYFFHQRPSAQLPHDSPIKIVKEK